MEVSIVVSSNQVKGSSLKGASARQWVYGAGLYAKNQRKKTCQISLLTVFLFSIS
jgi:hypothetical protein